MRTKQEYCCDASRLAYQRYYMGQVGSGQSGIFIGSKNQKGHGFGSMLSGLFRSAAPILKKGLASFGKSALSTGLSIATDVLDGRNARESARQRVSEGIKNMTRETGLVNSGEQPEEADAEEYEEEEEGKRSTQRRRPGVHRLKRKRQVGGGCHFVKRRKGDILD